MPLTAEVKDELARVVVNRNTVRAAELATILRFAGGLHVISGRIAVEVELDTRIIVHRVRKDLAELYGVRSEASVGSSASPVVARATWSGCSRRGRPSRARPASWTPAAGGPWPAEPLDHGQPRGPRRHLARRVPGVRHADRPGSRRRPRGHLPGQRGRDGARRGSVASRHRREGPRGPRRPPRGHPRRRGHRPDAHRHGCRPHDRRVGGDASAPRGPRHGQPIVNFDDANLRRSAQAAVAACARVERALEILGDEVPTTSSTPVPCGCSTATHRSTSSVSTPSRR